MRRFGLFRPVCGCGLVAVLLLGGCSQADDATPATTTTAIGEPPTSMTAPETSTTTSVLVPSTTAPEPGATTVPPPVLPTAPRRPPPEPATSGAVLVVHDGRDGGSFRQGPYSRFAPVTLLADGNLYARDLGSAGRTVAPAHVASLDRAQLRQVVADAVAAGVTDPPPDLGSAIVADAPSTIFTLRTTTAEVRVAAHGLGFSEDSGGRTPEQRAARRRLIDFLGSVDARAAAGSVYEPSLLGVSSHDPDAPYLHDTESGEARWPGATPLRDGTCQVLGGADLARALPVLRGAAPTTVWTSGGTRHRITTRVALPGEDPCVVR